MSLCAGMSCLWSRAAVEIVGWKCQPDTMRLCTCTARQEQPELKSRTWSLTPSSRLKFRYVTLSAPTAMVLSHCQPPLLWSCHTVRVHCYGSCHTVRVHCYGSCHTVSLHCNGSCHAVMGPVTLSALTAMGPVTLSKFTAMGPVTLSAFTAMSLVMLLCVLSHCQPSLQWVLSHCQPLLRWVLSHCQSSFVCICVNVIIIHMVLTKTLFWSVYNIYNNL